jgi:hypothetical protein
MDTLYAKYGVSIAFHLQTNIESLSRTSIQNTAKFKCSTWKM